MSNLPHFLTDPVDPKGQVFRADCMAWELFTKKSKADRDAFIAVNPGLQTREFQECLRRVEAWWLLTYCNHQQIGLIVAEMPVMEEMAMRKHLQVMRIEIKKARQRKHKTFMGNQANA